MILIENQGNCCPFNQMTWSLTLGCRRSLSYRNQSIDLLCKSMDWFLYDRERVMKELMKPMRQISKCISDYFDPIFHLTH